jgi:hypothetical protein
MHHYPVPINGKDNEKWECLDSPLSVHKQQETYSSYTKTISPIVIWNQHKQLRLHTIKQKRERIMCSYEHFKSGAFISHPGGEDSSDT